MSEREPKMTAGDLEQLHSLLWRFFLAYTREDAGARDVVSEAGRYVEDAMFREGYVTTPPALGRCAECGMMLMVYPTVHCPRCAAGSAHATEPPPDSRAGRCLYCSADPADGCVHLDEARRRGWDVSAMLVPEPPPEQAAGRDVWLEEESESRPEPAGGGSPEGWWDSALHSEWGGRTYHQRLCAGTTTERIEAAEDIAEKAWREAYAAALRDAVPEAVRRWREVPKLRRDYIRDRLRYCGHGSGSGDYDRAAAALEAITTTATQEKPTETHAEDVAALASKHEWTKLQMTAKDAAGNEYAYTLNGSASAVDRVIDGIPGSPVAPEYDDEDIARMFHEAYERLAPSFGYQTREESAKPWKDVPIANRRLMTAVVHEVRDVLRRADPARPEPAGDVVERARSLWRMCITGVPRGDGRRDCPGWCMCAECERAKVGAIAAALRDAVPEAVRRWREASHAEHVYARATLLDEAAGPVKGTKAAQACSLAADVLEALVAEPTDTDGERMHKYHECPGCGAGPEYSACAADCEMQEFPAEPTTDGEREP